MAATALLELQRRQQALRRRAGPEGGRLRGLRGGGGGACRRQRRRQVHPRQDRSSGIYPPTRASTSSRASRSRSRRRRTRPRWGSRPSTRTSRCATTSTWWPTCSSATRRSSGLGSHAVAGRDDDGAAGQRAARAARGDRSPACAPRWRRSRVASANRWRSRARCWASRRW